MKVADFDAAFPDALWRDGGGVVIQQARVEAAATHVCRAALGLPTIPPLLDSMRRALSGVISGYGSELQTGFGLIALTGLYYRDWDLVAAATGGAPLGTELRPGQSFGADARGLARYLATAVRARLPGHVTAAMNEQRERFAKGIGDPRIPVIAAHVFARDLAVAHDPRDATRRWLGGEELELMAASVVDAVADGEDPRVMIFERWASELADETGIDLEVSLVGATADWNRNVKNDLLRARFDDLAIRAFVARRPPFERWERIVDPAVAAWLGAPERPETGARFRDLEELRLAHLPNRSWTYDLESLAYATDAQLAELRDIPAFRPHRFFQDDGRKLVEYLIAAVRSGASVGDVEPAWCDFLARRSPGTTPRIEGVLLRWRDMLTLQAAITCRIGKAPRGAAGAALRHAIADVR